MDKNELLVWLYEQKDKIEYDRTKDADYITPPRPKDDTYYAKIDTFNEVIKKVKSITEGN